MSSALVEQLLERPDNFMYFGENKEMFKTWSIGPVIETRDSDSVERRKAERITGLLTKNKVFDGLWSIERSSHWAVGWVDHLTFQVLDSEGKETPICASIIRWYGNKDREV